MKNDKLKVGVIGVGHLGEYHVQKYLKIPNVDLVGVADTDFNRAKEIEKRYGVKAYNEPKELLKKIEAASLVVPTEAHFEVAKDILDDGVNLLIEKPITYKLTPADTLIKIAKEKALVLQVGLVERFNPAIVRMEALTRQPVFIEAHRLNKFTTRGTDVDVVLDLMIHDLDIILHMVQSEVKEIHAVGICVITGKTDIANVRLIFENGVVANLTASRVSEKTIRKIRVFQHDLYMDANYVKKQLSVIHLDNGTSDLSCYSNLQAEIEAFPESDPLKDEISSFVDTVRKKTKPVVTGEDCRKALEITLAIIDQIKNGATQFQSLC